jgi:protein phosphatase
MREGVPLLVKPLDHEVDVFGITHVGRVRKNNQDHFLIASLRKQLDVHATSLPTMQLQPPGTDRLAFLAMVADGVGGSAGGEEASGFTVETIASYLTHSTHCYYTADAGNDAAFIEALENAALRCHEELLQRGEREGRRMGATTLTLILSVWPRAYLLQVGDSRYYLLRDGVLTQVSRDQTMAQELIDRGVFTRTDRAAAQLAHTLSSAIGGPQTDPMVTGVELDWGVVNLLCSDGLTKHVSDEQIRQRLMTMTSAQQVCEDLMDDALSAGGTDNITIVVGRAVHGGAPST